ncbi:MAG: alpha/beta fold hydrolase [Acidimicrobiales bacterium]
MKWWDGKDPVGERISTIAIPVLITDGSLDKTDATVNDRSLAQMIKGAEISLYPDAGHAFLFQDWAKVSSRIGSFLG